MKRIPICHQKASNIKKFDFTDDVMGDEDDEEESDAIVNQVLDELGLQLNDKIGDAPIGKLGFQLKISPIDDNHLYIQMHIWLQCVTIEF